MSFLTLTNIQKSFGPVQVVHGFDMAIEKGEFVSFLGPRPAARPPSCA